MSKHAVSFMSYVRFDDQHENGRLSQFCERLASEVRVQTGEKFHIFQDRNDIAWGQQWQQRIDQSLDAVTFFIPMITPSFFKSVACRAELERFLDREQQLQRNDLILPVYYVNCAIFSNEANLQADPLAKVIAGRQYADWRELRFEPFTSPQVGKMLAKIALQIVAALERDQQQSDSPSGPGAASEKNKKNNTSTASERMESQTQQADTPNRPAPKTEPPTLVVDAFHRGDHATLTAALKAAKPGDRILVQPGLYREGVVIDKAVEIIGDGELGEVVIEADKKNVVLFKANMGRIANLTLRQTGGEKYCINIAQGRLELEGCDISSLGLACVAIHGGADPRLRRNCIHDGKQSGIYVYDNGQGTLEDNDIFANAFSGITVKEGGNPTLRRNRIHDGKAGGVHVFDNGEGTLEDNDIFANAFSGITIKEGGNPTLRRNRIHDGKQCGVFVYDKGQGTLEDNDIYANAFQGVAIKKGGNPSLRRNRIIKNSYTAIKIYDGGQGVFEDNDLRGNAQGAWKISPDCQDNIKQSGNQE